MAALSDNRNTAQMGSGIPKLMSYPVKTGVTIYKGALVVVDSSGYAKPGVSEASDTCVGRATTGVVAGALASGTYFVEVEQGVFKWAVNGTAVTIANIGALCWVYNDQTVTLSSASASIAGTIYGVDSDGGVWVYSGLAAPLDGSTISTVAANLAQEIVDLANTTTGTGASLIGVQDTGSLYTAAQVEAALAEVMKVANAGNAGPVNIPVVLSTAITSTTVYTFAAPFAGKVQGLEACVRTIVTGASKSATFAVSIAGSAVTGATVNLTSANCATLGARITGASVTASNTTNGFTAGQLITIATSSSNTPFVEGEAHILLFLKSA